MICVLYFQVHTTQFTMTHSPFTSTQKCVQGHTYFNAWRMCLKGEIKSTNILRKPWNIQRLATRILMGRTYQTWFSSVVRHTTFLYLSFYRYTETIRCSQSTVFLIWVISALNAGDLNRQFLISTTNNIAIAYHQSNLYEYSNRILKS